jgi:hypothetical protein
VGFLVNLKDRENTMTTREVFCSTSFRESHKAEFTELHKQRGIPRVEEFVRQFKVLWEQAEAKLDEC